VDAISSLEEPEARSSSSSIFSRASKNCFAQTTKAYMAEDADVALLLRADRSGIFTPHFVLLSLSAF
jgi:hypothetical protein